MNLLSTLRAGCIGLGTAALLATFSPHALASSDSYSLRGDVTLDGKVDIKDAQAALQGILKVMPFSSQQTLSADVNGDGVVNIADVIAILRITTGVEPLVAEAPPATNDVVDDAEPLGKNRAKNYWEQRVDTNPVDPNSATLLTSIGLATSLHPDFGADYEGAPNGIPFMETNGDVPALPTTFSWDDESDNGAYPVPLTAPVEGGPNADGDRHVIVVDKAHHKLYEMYNAYPGSGGWSADAGAVWDTDTYAPRPAGWTSADAAGLPIYPGLVKYDEVASGVVKHAFRFTVKRSRKAYVYPATHYASSKTDPTLPPMGMRVRLKASVNITNYPKQAQPILKALKSYGMILADNGGNWFMSGAPDNRWDDDQLNTLKQIKGSDFEVVQMSEPVIGK